jgi:RNA polymerase sigma-70 factor (ECF subfamily)
VERPFYSNEQFNCEALRRQDAIEFERLYYAYAPALRVYLTRLCGDKELANDLLQETFVKAYKALPRLQTLEPRPWLYKIATNTARTSARLVRWKRVLPFGDNLPNQPDPTSFENRLAETEMVEHALAAIKPDYSAVLLLHWREGFSIEELCTILGLSKDNLKKRLYRAKKAFSAAYQKECAAYDKGRA